jgi:hypothetical protein
MPWANILDGRILLAAYPMTTIRDIRERYIVHASDLDRRLMRVPVDATALSMTPVGKYRTSER